jgi:hypothetical protein
MSNKINEFQLSKGKSCKIRINLVPDCVKGATSKLEAKIAITKETTSITQEVTRYRVPPLRVAW